MSSSSGDSSGYTQRSLPAKLVCVGSCASRYSTAQNHRLAS